MTTDQKLAFSLDIDNIARRKCLYQTLNPFQGEYHQYDFSFTYPLEGKTKEYILTVSIFLK
jgi:hypothetical protein